MFKKMNGKMENFAIELETKCKQPNLKLIKINKCNGSTTDKADWKTKNLENKQQKKCIQTESQRGKKDGKHQKECNRYIIRGRKVRCMYN